MLLLFLTIPFASDPLYGDESQRRFFLFRLRFLLGRFVPEPGGVTRPPLGRLPERPRAGALPVRPALLVGPAGVDVPLWVRVPRRVGDLALSWVRFRAGALAFVGFASRFGVGAPLPSVDDLGERSLASAAVEPSAAASARCLAIFAPSESSPR